MLPDVSAQQWKLALHPPRTPSCSAFYFPIMHCSVSTAWWWSTLKDMHRIKSTHWWRIVFISIIKLYNYSLYEVTCRLFQIRSAVKTYFVCLPLARRKKRSICCPWITWSSEMWRKDLCPQSTSLQSSTPNRGEVYVFIEHICVNYTCTFVHLNCRSKVWNPATKDAGKAYGL